jgi:conjugative transfer signal peptidase TraF
MSKPFVAKGADACLNTISTISRAGRANRVDRIMVDPGGGQTAAVASSPGRALWLCLAGAGLLALGVSTLAFTPRLVWNASPSSPRGFYLLVGPHRLAPGVYVAARPPAHAAAMAATRGYLPAHLPLIKTVAAVAGDHVCVRGWRVLVNGRLMAVQLDRDGASRGLPRWRGCRPLGSGELLLLGLGDARSFDSRYFGPIGHDRVIGRALLLWQA